MNIKGLLLVLVLFSISLFVPKTSQAFNLQEVLTSQDSILVKIQEKVEYFLAFKTEKKIEVLEKQAEKILAAAQDYAQKGNNEKVQNMIQNYQQTKEKQNNLLGKISDEQVLGMVAERTVEQQKIMENIKTRMDEGTKQEVIQVQEEVVNQVAKQVVEVSGSEGATSFLNEVVHVWAPGTGPGGESGVVYEGGGKLIYASGTGPGGQGGVVIEGGEMKFATGTSMDSPGADVKNVEVKTGGGINDPVPVPDGPNYAPGTTGNSSGDTNAGPGINTIDPGGLAPGTTLEGKNELAP